MKLCIAKCVWGARYVRTMLELNLPSLLASANLPAAAARVTVEHLLVTTAEDRAIIEASPVYKALSQVVSCRIIPLDETPVSVGYLGTIDRMNRSHIQILADCRSTGAHWIFDQPDHIWGSGSLNHLAMLAESGVRCALFAGIRTIQQDMEPMLSTWRQGTTLDIDRDSLLRLSIEHMHVHDRTRFWGAPLGTLAPHHLNWRVGPQSFLRRVYYAQPFLMAVPSKHVAPTRSVDLDYVEQAYMPEELHQIASSRDFLVVEVSDRWHFKDQTTHPLTIPYMASWTGRYVTGRQMAVFNQPIRFQADATPERHWRRLIRYSAQVGQAIHVAWELRKAQIALAVDHPLLAALLGRFLREPTATFRATPIPAHACFFAPTPAELTEWLALPMPDLLCRVRGRLGSWPVKGVPFRTLDGKVLDLRQGDDVQLDGCAMRSVNVPGPIRLFVPVDDTDESP